MNRDYFTRPDQGNGRDGHDYGHGGGFEPTPEPFVTRYQVWILGAVIVLLTMWLVSR